MRSYDEVGFDINSVDYDYMVVTQNSFFNEEQRKMQGMVKQIIDQVKTIHCELGEGNLGRHLVG